MHTDEIILHIENTAVICKKQLLTRNSDYFRAMFEDDFREKTMSIIKLEGVDLRAMQVIVTLLNNETNTVLYEDILMVLQVACMLQFISIARWCLKKVSQVLCTRNCLEVWLITELLSMKSISLKAKHIAMNEFMVVKNNECIHDLPLKQLCDYVGNVNLRTDSELFVFETVMKWWRKNSRHFRENSTETLFILLSCVDYNNLSEGDLKLIIRYPDILANNIIRETMNCLLHLKNGLSIDQFPQSSRCNALLLNSSKSRVPNSCPCILVRSADPANSKKKVIEVTLGDADNKQEENLTVAQTSRPDCCVIYYDKKSNQFKKFFDIDNTKSRNLEGFKIVGYRGYVLMYGGQYVIGRGLWNLNFWTYDFIREQWETRTDLPHRRSHFESCIAKDQVFILGGMGNFRIRQENLYWYNFSENKWSPLSALPLNERQLKCCEFLKEFVAFNVNAKCAFFYTRDVTGNWTWTTKQLIIEDGILDDEPIFELVSHKDKLYVKGKKLIEFGLTDGNIKMSSVKNITNIDFDALEVTVCCDTLYTLYKYHNEVKTLYSFEKYNFDTGAIEYIFTDRSSFEIDGDNLEISENMKLFSVNHYSLLETNDYINRSYL